MKKNTLRFFEIIGGGALILVGIVMIITPGPAVVAIVAGIMLISPHHGRRVVWWIRELWRGFKGWWYSLRFKRVVRRKIIKRAKALKKKLKLKK